MEWREVLARMRARCASASPGARVRAYIAVVATVAVTVAVIAVVAARSGSAASPAGAAPRSLASRETAPAVATTIGTSSPQSARAGVVVSVAGAVTRPGVVTLPSGARVVDAIAAAGGAASGADPNALDLAAKLADGVRVYVPKVGEHVSPMPAGDPAASVGNAPSSGAAPSGPLDLNTATEPQLEALPGIGPSLAQAILTERDRLGGFHSVDDLRQVRGIGDRRLADLRPLVTV